MLDELINSLKLNEISLRSFISTIKNSKDLINIVNQKTNFLDEYNVDILERLYYIINDIHKPVKCAYCNNKATFTGRIKDGYRKTCSNKECQSKMFANKMQGSTLISKNRDEAFIKLQNTINDVNDNIIKDILKYDKFLSLVTNEKILNYLDNRFEDSSSRLESLQRIRFGIEEKPKCPTCGNPVVWVGKQSKLYTTYCCDSCSNKNKETIKKKKETQLKNWGTENCYDSEKYRQQYKTKYGVEYFWQREDIKEKKKKTTREKYGYDYATQAEEIKQKVWETAKKHATFASSSEEQNLYEYLKNYFPDIIHHYKSDDYPFNCDYYIPSEDLYIEYQGSLYHNGRAFFNTEEDQLDIQKFKEKSNERENILGKGSKYQAIIDTWTIGDVKKREWAEYKKLNYLEIFRYNNLIEVLNQILFYLDCKHNRNFYHIQDKKLLKCYEHYKNLKFIDDRVFDFKSVTPIIKHFQCQNFFKNEMEIFANDPITRRRLIQNRIKYLNKKETELTPDDIITGFKKSGIYYGYSHFNPQWTNWFVNKYNIKTIYDPCGGWGHHLLGMLNCDKIIYNDFSKSTVEGVQQIKDYFNIDNLEVHYGDGSEYIPEEVDGWFMCPPYYNLEHYECGDFNSLDEYKIFLNKIIKLWQNSSSRVFGVILREDLIDYIGIKPNEIYDMKIHKTHLNGGKKKLDEKFYIFKK